jgi:signal transduction histidine kinase
MTVVARPSPVREATEARRLQALGALAAGIAHELNTPAQYVGDNLRFLETAFQQIATLVPSPSESSRTASIADGAGAVDLTYLLEEVPSAIAQSLEGLGYVGRLVSVMKQFASAPVDTLDLVDLNALVQSVVALARNEWKYSTHVTLALDDALPGVPGVPGELMHVVLALLLEAARASRAAEADGRGRSGEQSAIAIRTSRRGEWAVLELEDGCGPTETARVALTCACPTGVTRPDLAFVRGIVVDGHRGGIDIEPALGGGTMVVVRLPLTNEGYGDA